MHKGFAILLLTAVIGLTSCDRGHKFTPNEYDVVSAYVAGKFASHKGEEQASKVMILNKTSSGDDDLLRDENGQPVPWEKIAQLLHQKAPSLQQTTMDSFRKANARQALLGHAFQFPVQYEIIDSAQVESAFKSNGGGWPGYYKQYPGSNGITTVSRVGFSADGTQALFYIGHRCGGLCGAGWYVVMEKRDGRWLMSQEIQMWVS